MSAPPAFDPALLDHLRQLPFVRELKYTPELSRRDKRFDGRLRIRTPIGPFHLLAEEKRSYLTQASVNASVGWADHLASDDHQGVILLARYVPRSMAEDLIAHHVNFVDRVGNIHLRLGPTYSWTVTGVPDEKIPEKRLVSPAQLQLLFEFVTDPDSANWPVRQLEDSSGIKKSKAAQVRKQLLEQGLLIRQGGKYQIGPLALVSERLVSGYAQVLRPKLIVGRFRYPEKTVKLFLDRLRKEPPFSYALTGGPAANILQRYYRGIEIPVFLAPWSRSRAQQLRLLPDREGPVQVLTAFGKVVFWEKKQDLWLAPPWLTYVELLSATDPRAKEAAEEFRRAFLP